MKTSLSPEQLTLTQNARRVFLMVRELHKLGYEGIRACPYMSPSGCHWRCAVVPASMTDPNHGARLANKVTHLNLPVYSSAHGDIYFGWLNPKPKCPLAMANWFIWEFQTLAQRGHHPDPDYAQWFATMLEQTAPFGVVTAFRDDMGLSLEDGGPLATQMITDFCDENLVVRYPPPWCDDGDFND